jgi:hypothetical protein
MGYKRVRPSSWRSSRRGGESPFCDRRTSGLRDSAKAWALLARHSPGVALPDRVIVVSDEAVRALAKAGNRSTELSREAGVSGAAADERT